MIYGLATSYFHFSSTAMQPNKSLLVLLFFACLISACDEDRGFNPSSETGMPDLNRWSIPVDEVENGGPGKDGIPAIDNPNFTPVFQVTDLMEDDLVIVFRLGNEVRIYPHRILDWHEVVNDVVGDTPVAITYCPLTGTASAWSRKVDGEVTTFGVSGLLYSSNLLAYDRNTDSYWSQIRGDCVNGVFLGRIANSYRFIETTWETARELFSEALVLNRNTGFNRNYNFYPYGGYRTNDNVFSPVRNLDRTLQIKERVLGVASDLRTRAYRFEDFEEPRIVKETFGGKTYLIIGDATKNYLVAYEISTQNDVTYSLIESALNPAIIMEDSNGNQWDILGRAVAGPKKGEELIKANSFIGFWFGWAAFHPRIEIFAQ